MNRSIQYCMVCITILICVTSVTIKASNETNKRYVQSKRVTLLDQASMKAKAIATLPKGATLRVEKRKGMWLLVRYKNKKGWVSKYQVSLYNPLITKKALETPRKVNLKKLARRRASSYVTAAASRGLLGRAKTKSTTKIDTTLINKIESHHKDLDQINDFMNAGGL